MRRFLYYLSVHGLLAIFCNDSLAVEGVCPKSARIAINEYYSAIRRVDLGTLEELTGSKEWIHREQIVEMSKGLKHFEVLSIKPSKQKGAKPKTSAYIRVEIHWKDPESKSRSYFEVRQSNGCWKILDSGAEDD